MSWIYQAFEYDSSVIDYQTYLNDLLRRGWQDFDSSKEFEEHGWPLTQSLRLHTHRDPNIAFIVLKRESVNPPLTGERNENG